MKRRILILFLIFLLFLAFVGFLSYKNLIPNLYFGYRKILNGGRVTKDETSRFNAGLKNEKIASRSCVSLLKIIQKSINGTTEGIRKNIGDINKDGRVDIFDQVLAARKAKDEKWCLEILNQQGLKISPLKK